MQAELLAQDTWVTIRGGGVATMGKRENKRKRREWEREQERQRDMERAMTMPRLVDEPVGWWGSGLPILQLIRLPSFEPEEAWEVRRPPEGLVVYASSVRRIGFRSLQLVGMQPLEVPSRTLEEFWAEVTSLELSLDIDGDRQGLDGTSYELAVFGELSVRIRVRWWEQPPPRWEPLGNLADRMIEVFRGAPTATFPANGG
jgi:hypothetical protein